VRRVAIASIACWSLLAWFVLLHDKRPLGARVMARSAAQRGVHATVAWIEGPTRASPRGHLVVARALANGSLERWAARALPGDGGDCRLWLEESSAAEQAVASCVGFAPMRLTADGAVLPPLGPVDRPAILYDLVPLHTFDPNPLIDSIRPTEARERHPLVSALGLLAFLPLFLLGMARLREARRADARPRDESELPGEPAARLRRAARRNLTFAAAGSVAALLVGCGIF